MKTATEGWLRPAGVLAALLAVGLAGCGSPSGQADGPTPTPVSLKTYQDRQNHFSFKYPSTWKVRAPVERPLNGVPTYIVTLAPPVGSDGVRITVDHQVTPFPAFVNGHVANDPNGGADLFVYHHGRVSGWPAMVIQRHDPKKRVDGLFTIVNTHSTSYQIEMVTGTPPFDRDVLAGYNTIVRTMKLPFS